MKNLLIILLVSLALAPAFISPQVAEATTEADCQAIGQSWIPQDGGTCVKPVDTARALGDAAGTFWNWVSPFYWIRVFSAVTVNSVLAIFGWLVYMAGVLFNLTVMTTVVDMARVVKNIIVIEEGWKIFRDLANVSFIFMLLYAGINTIIGVSSSLKSVIINVIIAGLLINFSLFFTKVGIDASNIVATQFYNGIIGTNCPGKLDGCISEIFADSLRIGSAFKGFNSAKPQGITTEEQLRITTVASDTSLAGIVTVGVVGSLFLILVAFVFLYATVLLLVRFVTFIILMVSSPIYFLALIIPETKGLRDLWMSRFLSNIFYAPIFMAFLYLTAKVVTSTGFQNVVARAGGINPESSVAKPLGTIVDAITYGTGEVVLNFVIVFGFLITSIVAAQQFSNGFGATASSFAGRFSFGAAGFALRNSLGRGLEALSKNKRIQSWARGEGRFQLAGRLAGGAALATADYGARSSFDFRGIKNLQNLYGNVSTGTPGGAGGYIAERDQRKAKATKRAGELEKLYDLGGFEAEDLKTAQEQINEANRKMGVILADKVREYGEAEAELRKERENMNDLREKLKEMQADRKTKGGKYSDEDIENQKIKIGDQKVIIENREGRLEYIEERRQKEVGDQKKVIKGLEGALAGVKNKRKEEFAKITPPPTSTLGRILRMPGELIAGTPVVGPAPITALGAKAEIPIVEDSLKKIDEKIAENNKELARLQGLAREGKLKKSLYKYIQDLNKEIYGEGTGSARVSGLVDEKAAAEKRIRDLKKIITVEEKK